MSVRMENKVARMLAHGIAAPGTVWVCRRCGKTSTIRWEFGGGWDESCMMNAVLCVDSDERPWRKVESDVVNPMPARRA